MTGASVSCFGERYQNVLPQNLDEKKKLKQVQTAVQQSYASFSLSTGMCVSYIQFAGYTSVYVVCSYVELNSVLVADDDTTAAVSPTRRRAHGKTYGIRNRRRNVYASHEV